MALRFLLLSPFTLGQARDRQDPLTVLSILCLIKHSITSVYEEGALESMLQIETNLQSTTPLRMLGRKRGGQNKNQSKRGDIAQSQWCRPMLPTLLLSIRITKGKKEENSFSNSKRGGDLVPSCPGELHGRSEWFLPLPSPAGATRGYCIRVLVSRFKSEWMYKVRWLVSWNRR